VTATAPTLRDAALDCLSALVQEDGRRWAEVAHPFQWDDARAVLDPESSEPYHFLTRGRGGAKTSDLAAMLIAVMIEQAPPGAMLYAVAADRDQGRLLLQAIEGYQARTPMLGGVLKLGAFQVSAPRRGATLEILAADAAGAWGLRPYFIVVDEVAQWPATPSARQLWEAVTTAAAKRPDCRMACLTSAGDPAHWAHTVREHARTSELWRLHEVPGPVPWLDAARLAEQRARIPESSFARLFLNEWTTAEDRLANLDDLRACVTLDGPQDPERRHRYVVGVDLGIKSDRTVAVVAHADGVATPDNDVRPPRFRGDRPRRRNPPSDPWQAARLEAAKVHAFVPGEIPDGATIAVDRMAVWQGSRLRPVKLAEVEAWVEQAARDYHARVVIDPWQAVGLAQRLRSRGVQITEFTFSSGSVGRLASTLHLLIRNRALALPDDAELIDELANVRLRETSPGVLRMDHDQGQHDDRAIALALAAQQLLSRPAGRMRKIRGPRGR